MAVAIYLLLAACLTVLVTQVNASCLPLAIEESKRVNLSMGLLHAKPAIPLGIWKSGWASGNLLAEMLKIIAEEVLGIQTSMGQGSSSVDGLYAICGCQDPNNAEDRGCPQHKNQMSRVHVAMEVWSFLSSRKVLSDVIPWCDFLKPMGGIGFKGNDGMHVLNKNSFAALRDIGLPLEFYKSYNTTWHKPWEYFPSMSVVNESLLSPCRKTKLSDYGIMRSYLDVTGDEGGVVRSSSSVSARCWHGVWWIAPACRHDMSKCIPVITGGNGWGLDQLMMQATGSGMPVAIAIASTDADYESIPRIHSSLLYSWWPDTTFIDLAPVTVIQPVHDEEAWASGDKTTQGTRLELSKVIHDDLTFASPELSTLLSNWKIGPSTIDRILLEYKQKRRDLSEAEIACGWLQSNEQIWKPWIPTKTSCGPGLGLVGRAGSYVFSRSEATACQWCKAGTISVELVDGRGMTRTCEPCPKGKYQDLPGQEKCEQCPLGQFANQVGMSTCRECMPGTIGGKSGLSSCAPCMPGTYSGHPGQHQCLGCSNGTFAPAQGAAECQVCPAGGDCTSGVQAVAAPDHFATAVGFQKCFVPNACVGNGSCATGMKGPACGMCSIGFTRVEDHGLCLACPEIWQNNLLVALTSLAYSAYVALMIFFLVRKNKEKQSMNSAFIKNFTSYMQMTAMALSVCPLGIREFLAGIDVLHRASEKPTSVMAIDCLLRKTDADDSDGIFEMKLLLIALLAIPAALLVFVSCDVLLQKVARRPLFGGFKNSVISGSVVLVFLLHPVTADIFISQSVGCIKVDVVRLSGNVELECFGASHLRNVGIASIGLVFFTAGLPAIFFKCLHHYRGHLSHGWAKRYFGFLYAGYNREFYYWECVIMLRKTIILLAAKVYSEQPYAKPLRMLIVGGLFLTMQVGMNPFNDLHDGVLDKLERRGLVAFCLIPASYMLMNFEAPLGMSSDAADLLNTCLLWVNVVAHAAYLSFYVRMLAEIVLGNILKWYPPDSVSGLFGYILAKLQDTCLQHDMTISPSGEIDVSCLRPSEEAQVHDILGYLAAHLAEADNSCIDPKSLQMSLQCIAREQAQHLLDAATEQQALPSQSGILSSVRSFSASMLSLPANWMSEDTGATVLYKAAEEAISWMRENGFSQGEREIKMSPDELYMLVDSFIDDISCHKTITLSSKPADIEDLLHFSVAVAPMRKPGAEPDQIQACHITAGSRIGDLELDLDAGSHEDSSGREPDRDEKLDGVPSERISLYSDQAVQREPLQDVEVIQDTDGFLQSDPEQLVGPRGEAVEQVPVAVMPPFPKKQYQDSSIQTEALPHNVDAHASQASQGTQTDSVPRGDIEGRPALVPAMGVQTDSVPQGDIEDHPALPVPAMAIMASRSMMSCQSQQGQASVQTEAVGRFAFGNLQLDGKTKVTSSLTLAHVLEDVKIFHVQSRT